MPPVANPFKEATDRLMAGGTSLRQVSKRLAELDSSKTAQAWYDELKRCRRTGRVSEARMALFARGFGVSRSSLPAASTRPTLAGLELRLEAAEAEAARAEQARQRLAETVHLLAARLETTAEIALDLGRQAGLDVSALEQPLVQNDDG